MKLTRDELMEVFAEVSVIEVKRYREATHISPLEEFSILLLMSKILDGVEEKIFK